jgi:hypothetical protein
MYRAQSDVEYYPENANLAAAGGVLAYIHKEVVGRKQSCNCEPGDKPPCFHRHYSVTRILRFNVSVYNSVSGGFSNFGHFTQFDSGQCTLGKDHCKKFFKDKGYNVGCQIQAQVGGTPVQATDYGAANVWYSLPGGCPSLKWNDPQKKACAKAEPGGLCAAQPTLTKPDGTRDCTWKVEKAGEVSLDELAGISDHKQFCADGNYEYEDISDKGKGTTFWDNKTDKQKNLERIEKLKEAFAKKYPESFNGSPDPICDESH